jgi:hypothetical protein
MAYFADLAPYAYGHRLQPGVVHVGWLDSIHDFPRGKVPKALVEKLKLMAANPVEICRGYHLCELCDKPEEAQLIPVPNRVVSRPNEAWTQWAKPRMSYGEIRVTRGGITYAAPMNVAHYIEAHGYLPPAEFLKAVEEAPNQAVQATAATPRS